MDDDDKKQKFFSGRWWVKTLGGFVVCTTDDFDKANACAEAFQKITGRTAFVYDAF